jgi:hypothetical protein
MRFRVVASLVAIALSCLDCTPGFTEPLHVNNGTRLAVTVLVNGQVIRTVGPLSGVVEIPPEGLPPVPWNVDVRSPSGRLLLDLIVRPEVVTRATGMGGQVSLTGAAARVDLSCGRLDVWVGPPLLGPSPEPGHPGDCDP